MKIPSSTKKDAFIENIEQAILLYESTKLEESMEIDSLKVDALELQISVRKTAIEEDYEAKRDEKKLKKKLHNKDKKHKHKEHREHVTHDNEHTEGKTQDDEEEE